MELCCCLRAFRMRASSLTLILCSSRQCLIPSVSVFERSSHSKLQFRLLFSDVLWLRYFIQLDDNERPLCKRSFFVSWKDVVCNTRDQTWRPQETITTVAEPTAVAAVFSFDCVSAWAWAAVAVAAVAAVRLPLLYSRRPCSVS